MNESLSNKLYRALKNDVAFGNLLNKLLFELSSKYLFCIYSRLFLSAHENTTTGYKLVQFYIDLYVSKPPALNTSKNDRLATILVHYSRWRNYVKKIVLGGKEMATNLKIVLN